MERHCTATAAAAAAAATPALTVLLLVLLVVDSTKTQLLQLLVVEIVTQTLTLTIYHNWRQRLRRLKNRAAAESGVRLAHRDKAYSKGLKHTQPLVFMCVCVGLQQS